MTDTPATRSLPPELLGTDPSRTLSLPPAEWAIGIDLGTTNTALAAALLPHGTDPHGLHGVVRAPAIVSLAQVVSAGETQACPLLPSFLYTPAMGELPPRSLALPWSDDKDDPSFCVGAFARDRGAQMPARVIASSKSWLCHTGVDRKAPILPQGAPDDVVKRSPVDVARALLAHAQRAWDDEHAGAPLAAQDVVLTVPASFDAVARSLTEDAARNLGFSRLTLLEEPTAALYAWVAARGDAWRKDVQVGDVILVVDVGGGTTDFSLIEVTEEQGQLELRRVAVGEHILLGGDNIDLALAHRMRADLEAAGKSLDDWQMRSLTHACRAAKEALLEDEALQSHAVVVAGRSSKLIGGTLKAELTRAVLTDLLLEGFFPAVARDARPAVHKRAGLTTLGLPYAHDAAITRHLAAFLSSSATAQPTSPAIAAPGRGREPTHVLFNGGVMKSEMLRERILLVLGSWLPQPVTVLEGADLDTAVAQGAASYARARAGRGVRIRSATVRAAYVGIERAELAVPGMAPRVDAVCVAPVGMEEGAEVRLAMELGLVVGEAASFRFFTSTGEADGHPLGAAVDPVKAGLVELAPVEATLSPDAPDDAAGAVEMGRVVPVHLHARVTEVGTLALAAVETRTGRRWPLAFNQRVAT